MGVSTKGQPIDKRRLVTTVNAIIKIQKISNTREVYRSIYEQCRRYILQYWDQDNAIKGEFEEVVLLPKLNFDSPETQTCFDYFYFDRDITLGQRRLLSEHKVL